VSHFPPPEPDERLLLTHATLVALTPLIPLPFVDDLVKGYLQRRTVRKLAARHGLRIWDEEVKQLADDPSTTAGAFVGGLAKKLVFAPVRAILRKTFLVLAGKSVVDLASRSYHHAWLIDRAFAHRWCAPAGTRTAKEVRSAVDEVLKETPVATSPITRALKLGYERSQSALVDGYTRLRTRLSGLTGASDASLEDAVEDASEAGVYDVVTQLLDSITSVPREHFDDLEDRLRRKLGPIELGPSNEEPSENGEPSEGAESA
jgi:hypothetical protein